MSFREFKNAASQFKASRKDQNVQLGNVGQLRGLMVIALYWAIVIIISKRISNYRPLVSCAVNKLQHLEYVIFGFGAC